jgi:hypothetical protein
MAEMPQSYWYDDGYDPLTGLEWDEISAAIDGGTYSAEYDTCPICDAWMIGPGLCVNGRNPHHV